MDRLALGALTVGVIFAFCASTPICALLLGIETVIAGDAAYYDAADHHGNGAFLDVYLWRVVWEYPDFGWGGFYWAWGHSHWVPYWASIS